MLVILAATNYTSILFPLLCLLRLMYICRLCLWSLAACNFRVCITIVANLGIEQLSVACRSNKPLPTQLPITPTNKRASFKAIKASFQIRSEQWVIYSLLSYFRLLVLVLTLLRVWQAQVLGKLGFLATPSRRKTEYLQPGAWTRQVGQPLHLLQWVWGAGSL